MARRSKDAPNKRSMMKTATMTVAVIAAALLSKDATGREVAAISGDKLQKATRAVRLPPEGDTTVLVPGRLTLLYIDAVLPDVRNIERLRHRLHLSDGKLHFQVEGGRTKLNPAAPADFGPPLRGGPWVAVYEP